MRCARRRGGAGVSRCALTPAQVLDRTLKELAAKDPGLFTKKLEVGRRSRCSTLIASPACAAARRGPAAGLAARAPVRPRRPLAEGHADCAARGTVPRGHHQGACVRAAAWRRPSASSVVVSISAQREDPRDALLVHPRHKVRALRGSPRFDCPPPGSRRALARAGRDPRCVRSQGCGGLHGLPADAVIGTSSLRRAALVLRRFPRMRLVNIRGNLQTRYRKLVEGDGDSACCAAAAAAAVAHRAVTCGTPSFAGSPFRRHHPGRGGLEPAGLAGPHRGGAVRRGVSVRRGAGRAGHRVQDGRRPGASLVACGATPLCTTPSGPGCAPRPASATALGSLPHGRSASQTRALVQCVTDADTFACCTAERAMLRSLQGGCQVPIAAASRVEAAQVHIRGVVMSEDGAACVEGTCRAWLRVVPSHPDL